MTEGECLNYLVARFVAHQIGSSVEALLSEAKEYYKTPTSKEPTLEVDSEDVRRIYDLYPAKDVRGGGRSTGKCTKDRKKIERLLRYHEAKDLEKMVSDYLCNCDSSGSYIKNFSTFLNSLPEKPEKVTEPTVALDQRWQDVTT